ncbi:MAG: LCP family protein [Christensenella sp.]|nr:LCP family protein [Christensenella sp.]
MNYKKGIKILTIVIVALGICAGGVVYALYGTYHNLRANPLSAFQENTAPQESDAINYDNNANVKTVSIDGKEYTANQNIISILMLGIDADGSEAKNAQGERSDMMLLCTINLEPGSEGITFTSLPRDTQAVVHDVDEDTGKILEKSWKTKLNHSYIIGGMTKGYGAQNTMRAVEDLIEIDGQLSIPIQYYISIDLAHLSDLANVLGGVEVTLDQDYPDIGSKGETINLQGDAVRLYLQNRKQMEDGEMDRQRHEMNFMMAIAKKIKELGAVDSASKLFTQLQDVVHMNLSLDQVVAMAGVLDKVSLDEIQHTVMEQGEYQTGVHDEFMGRDLDFYLMDQQELRDKMLALYYTPVA